VLREALHLVPYALIAALSPVGFAATLAVIGSGRLKALGFGVGFVAGQAIALAVLVQIGTAAIPNHEVAHPTFRALLEIGTGVALLLFALRENHRPRAASRPPSNRSKAVLDRLGRLHILTALAAGLLLGIGGPKRLVLTALVSASITATAIEGTKEAALIGWYVILATSLVWAPILGFVLFGDRVVDQLTAAEKWLARYQHQVVVYTLIVVGLFLVAAGALSLV
jgi:hypothetical protein